MALLSRKISAALAVSFVAWASFGASPCPEGQAPDADGKCTLCASGYAKNPKTGACEKLPTCPAGKVLVGTKCFPACGVGYKHDSQGKCTQCADGYLKNPKTGACQKSTQ